MHSTPDTGECPPEHPVRPEYPLIPSDCSLTRRKLASHCIQIAPRGKVRTGHLHHIAAEEHWQPCLAVSAPENP